MAWSCQVKDVIEEWAGGGAALLPELPVILLMAPLFFNAAYGAAAAAAVQQQSAYCQRVRYGVERVALPQRLRCCKEAGVYLF